MDLGDKHLEAAARREAVEEMGACPDFKNSGSIFTTCVRVAYARLSKSSQLRPVATNIPRDP